MTFVELDVPESSHQSQSTLTAPASSAANQTIPCSSITHTGLTVNGSGQLILSAGYTFILMGAPYISSSPGILESRWYDVTNSTFIGRSAQSWMNSANSPPTGGRRTPVARCLLTPSVSTTVEMRIVTATSSISINPSSPSADYVGTPWYSVISF